MFFCNGGCEKVKFGIQKNQAYPTNLKLGMFDITCSTHYKTTIRPLICPFYKTSSFYIIFRHKSHKFYHADNSCFKFIMTMLLKFKIGRKSLFLDN